MSSTSPIDPSDQSYQTDSIGDEVQHNAPVHDHETLHDQFSSRLTLSDTSDEKDQVLKVHRITQELVNKFSKRLLQSNENGDSLLHLAVRENTAQRKSLVPLLTYYDTMKLNIINAKNKLKQTPLHIAVVKNCPESVLLLLNSGADPNITDKDGNTAYHIAAKYKFSNCLSLMLSHQYEGYKQKFNVDAVNNDGLTTLHCAAISGDLKCIELLCKARANVNKVEHKSGRSSLHLVIEHPPNILEFLILQPGADINLQDYRGNTPLHLACSNNRLDAVFILRQNKADIFIENFENYSRNGKTPADFANGDEVILDMISPKENEISCKKDMERMKNAVTSQTTIIVEKATNDSGFLSSDDISLSFVSHITMNKLCEMLNPPNTGWETLAYCMGIDEICIKRIPKLCDNPTKIVLNTFQKEGGDREQLLNVLWLAELHEAHKVVRERSES